MVPGGACQNIRQEQLYHPECVANDMPEEEAPKIDFKALEAITKKVLEHQPVKKRKPMPKLTSGGEKHGNE